ncbi:hypothetical protein BC332_31375 [Capsicum chinense]|nr:hypothetical protein BC332_31375 [Capsicum chinense]
MIEEFKINDAESGFSHETAAERSGKRPAIDIHSHSNLDIQGLEDFSTVSPTEILKKADLITDASTSQLTKRQHVPAAKTTPSSSNKSVRPDNSDEKWDEIKLFLQSYIQIASHGQEGVSRLISIPHFQPEGCLGWRMLSIIGIDQEFFKLVNSTVESTSPGPSFAELHRASSWFDISGNARRASETFCAGSYRHTENTNCFILEVKLDETPQMLLDLDSHGRWLLSLQST